MTKAPLPDELTLSAHAHGDGIGHLFRWQGGLYRAIREEHAPFFRGLFDSGVLPGLIERGLVVGTCIDDMELPGYALVMKHASVPFVTYPTEWCGAMLRAAAVCTLDLQIELLKADATLLDAHGWNILFDAARPTMVDLTAIGQRSTDGRWHAESDFFFCMAYPARLAAKGRSDLARLMTDTTTVKDKDLSALVLPALAARARHLLWRAQHRMGLTSKEAGPLIRRLEHLRGQLAALELPGETTTSRMSTDAPQLTELIRECSPATVLAVGCGGTSIPHAAAHAGAKVVACDRDESLTTALYADAVAQDLDILPLLLDIEAKASTFGTFDRTPGPVTRRLGCDLVVASMQRPTRDPVTRAKADQRLATLLAMGRDGLLVRITPPAGGKSADDLPDPELVALLGVHSSEVSPALTDADGDWYRCAPRRRDTGADETG